MSAFIIVCKKVFVAAAQAVVRRAPRPVISSSVAVPVVRRTVRHAASVGPATFGGAGAVLLVCVAVPLNLQPLPVAPQPETIVTAPPLAPAYMPVGPIFAGNDFGLPYRPNLLTASVQSPHRFDCTSLNNQTAGDLCRQDHQRVPTETPVPEPAALAIFGSGVVGLALLMSRRRRAHPNPNQG